MHFTHLLLSTHVYKHEKLNHAPLSRVGSKFLEEKNMVSSFKDFHKIKQKLIMKPKILMVVFSFEGPGLSMGG